MKSIYLPLHHGKAPPWLLNRMKKLCYPIVRIIVDEFGYDELLRRFSDPIFFQSLSNVLGFDWNSSGSTTVLTGVLKAALNESELEVRVAGGKGKNALKTPDEIEKLGDELGLKSERIEELKRVSRLVAKVDSAMLQDGYELYHHAIIFTKKGWCVVQQGMNEVERLARRYHHSSFEWKIERPHSGIFAERVERRVMNLASKDSEEAREVILDVVRDGTFLRDYKRLTTIVRYKDGYTVPRKVDWKAIELAYNLGVDNFEDLLLIRGVGKGALRALALISELIYDTEYDKKDPAKFSFALGGKDGVPYPVDVRSYDEVIKFLEDVLKQAELGDFTKLRLLRDKLRPR